MTTPAWTRDFGVRLALAAAALGVAALAWALVGAFRTVPLAAPDGRTATTLETLAATPHRPAVDVDSVVDNDLFSADRSAPAVRYRLPTESRSADEAAPEPEKPAVLGTAVTTDGRSFATMKLGEGTPTLVHVGDRIGEWTVRAIARGKVTLDRANGARASIAAPKPGT